MPAESRASATVIMAVNVCAATSVIGVPNFCWYSAATARATGLRTA